MRIDIAKILVTTMLSIGAISFAAKPPTASRATSATAQAQVVDLNVTPPQPQFPLTGKIEAFEISKTADFTPGQLADGFIGDYVLQNDLVRAVFARPDKPRTGPVRGGSLIDIAPAGSPIDYLNAVNSTGDPTTTGSAAIYTDKNSLTVSGDTSAVLSMSGYLGDPDASEEIDAAHRINIETTWTLAANKPVLSATSKFTNKTTQTAYLLPADMVDWGEAGVFTEGSGFAANTLPTNFAIGVVDNWALGYFTSGTAPMEGYHKGRDSVILAQGKLSDLPHPDAGSGSSARDKSLNLGGFQSAGSASGSNDMVILPGTESNYRPGPGGTPVWSPTYVPRHLLRVVDGKTIVVKEFPGDTIFPDQKTTEAIAGRLTLKPGKSFTFTRYFVLSDKNWQRITIPAFQEKKLATGIIAGVVIEAGSEKRLAGADVKISGGSGWDGKSNAPAVLQTTSRPDGTFSAILPEGTYVLSTSMIGRAPMARTGPIKVNAGAAPQLTALLMTPESYVRIAVSEAETPTSSPLPVKLTFISKPPYQTINFGFSPDVHHGERNTCYLPKGSAVIPVTPGRYQLVISRGPEYDIVRKDVNLAPGSMETITASLPHVMKGLMPGMISMDAGIVTSQSGDGYATPESRAIQAACEGVQILVSGDYGSVTNLSAAIDKQGLSKWVRAFPGRRFFLQKNDLCADVFAYPLDKKTSVTLDKLIAKEKNLPPDIALSDLRKALPNLIFSISRPMDKERGYLNGFPFDERARAFEQDAVPPPDFDSIDIVEGKKLGQMTDVYPRYFGLQHSRLSKDSGTSPLSPTGSSFSRLPYGQEIGYPRTYLYTDKTLKNVSADDIVTATKGQHFMVTNGPILLFEGLDRDKREFTFKPGDVIDLKTTDQCLLRARVLAAPWVNLSGINLRENGVVGYSVSAIQPSEKIKRYPPVEDNNSNVFVRYFSSDTVVDAYAYSSRKGLDPVVPAALPDFGGEVYPLAWSAPIFIDCNGDGKIILSEPPEQTAPLLPLLKNPKP